MKNSVQLRLKDRSRTCVVCGCEATAGLNRFAKPVTKDEPVILALNVTIYRRDKHGRMLATSKAVRVCADCFVKAGASQTLTVDGRALGLALIQAALDRYSAMMEVNNKLANAERKLGIK